MPILSWIIYTLSDPRSGEVRYVGWTRNSPKQRLSAHVSEARKSARTHKNDWISELLQAGVKPVIETVESGFGNTWQEAERRWIAKYRATATVQILNRTDGGDASGLWGTREERSAASKLGHSRRSPEERSAIVKKSHLTRDREALRELGRKSMAAMQKTFSPERRSEISRKNNSRITLEQRILGGKQSQAQRTDEQRAAFAAQATLYRASRTPEQRSALVKKGHLKRTAEQRTRAGKLGAAARWRKS